MKYPIYTLAGFLTIGLLAFFQSCKKSNSSPNEVDPASTEYALEAVKVITTTNSPGLQQNSNYHFGFRDNTVYFGNGNFFKKYDIAKNTFTDLKVNTNLNFAGYGSRIINATGGLYYLGSTAIQYRMGGMIIYLNPWAEITYPDDVKDGERAIVAYGDKIYAAGGRDHPKSFSVYDTQTKTWAKLPTIPYDLKTGDGIAWNKKIFFFAGEQSNQGVIYDTENLTIESFTIPFSNTLFTSNDHQVVSFKDRIIVGDRGGQFHIYNPATGKWYAKEFKIEKFRDFNGFHLFAAENGSLYFTGVENSNFSLYELKLTLPEKE